MRAASQIALQAYRLAVLVAIAWIIRAHHVRMRVEGHAPIGIAEVAGIYPGAAALRPDPGERAGLFVLGQSGEQLGYVLRTAPVSDSIIGYRGPTDSLVAFDPALRVLGVRIRSSYDTREHVDDVREDRSFLKTWNGRSWEEVAGVTPEEAGIEGVSGASMTSMAIAEAIQRRLASSQAALALPPQPVRFSWRDAGLVLVVGCGIALAFAGTHGRPWLRRTFQAVVIGYVGLVSGDLLAQSLMVGWVQGGAAWRSAPGLVLLLAAALALPWAAGKPLYCQQLCPHGAAQELLHAVVPRRWRLRMPRGVDAGLRWLPGLLLGVVLIVTLAGLPVDLAHLEAFDAYLFRAAGAATLSIALAGLVASLFVPMAYCHYGCPTGALLGFLRARGRTDRFGRRDVAALVLVALAWTLSWKSEALYLWMIGGA